MFGKGFNASIIALGAMSLIQAGSGKPAEAADLNDANSLSPQAQVTAEKSKIEEHVKGKTRMILEQMKADINGDNMTNESEVSAVKSGLGDLMADVQIQTNKEFISTSDKQLFLEYKAELGDSPKMQELAMELVKGRKEFISNIIKTKRFDRFKTEADKIKSADRGWNSIIGKIFEGKITRGYTRLPINSPELIKYLMTNYEVLIQNQILLKPINKIILKQALYQTDQKLAQTDQKLAQTDQKLAQTEKELAQTEKELAESEKELAEATVVADFLAKFRK